MRDANDTDAIQSKLSSSHKAQLDCDENSNESSMKGRLSPAPFTPDGGLGPDERGTIENHLKGLGLRLLPFGFSSAMAIASDLDASQRDRFLAYTKLFNRYGLDFGDSTWLRQGHNPRTMGLYRYSFERDDPSTRPEFSRTFNESVAQYYLGNVDHLHAFLNDGPKLVLLDVGEHREVDFIVKLGALHESGPRDARSMGLFGIAVYGKCDGIEVHLHSGAPIAHWCPQQAPIKGVSLYTLNSDLDQQHVPIILSSIGGIRLWGARNVTKIALLSCHSKLILSRIGALRDINVEFNLVTEHSRLHFRHPLGAQRDDATLGDVLRDDKAPHKAVCGSFKDDTGFVFSTDADDPASYARVFPELDELGIRFVVVAAASQTVGYSVLDLVSPSPTRAGGGMYWARRTLPNAAEPPVGRTFDGDSFLDTFAPRVRKALAEMNTTPGLAWPIYTHLGALPPGTTDLPDPYIEESLLEALRNRSLGVGSTPASLWFTRASVLYDYALILRSIADHVEREGDVVEISSWWDVALGRMMPVSPAQLFGLTFYVENPKAADIRLDDVSVDYLVENPADASGRRSVSVARSEIRHTLIGQVDPVVLDAGQCEVDGSWRWKDGEGRLDGVISIAMGGRDHPSTQFISYKAAGPVGVVLHASSGGVFYFGPQSLAPADATAWRFVEPNEELRRVVHPFHDMTWRGGAETTSIPSHPIERVVVVGSGSVAELETLRPRATGLDRKAFTVAGCAPHAGDGAMVDLGTLRSTVDKNGYFLFEQVPAGDYDLSCEGWCDGRGRRVEVASDIGTLRLDRRV